MAFNPIDQNLKNRVFYRHFMVDCVVQNRNRLYLLGNRDYQDEIAAGEIDDQPEDSTKRAIRVDISDTETSVVKSDMTGYDWPIYCEMTYPEDRLVIIDGSGLPFFSGPGSVPRIKAAFEGGPLAGAVTRIRPIGKSGIILISNARDVLQHTGDQQWERIGQALQSDLPAYEGFADFDGFSLDEIYAVGGSGVVFKYDGKAWKQLDFPTNIGLSSVCCGGDSNVYVGAGGGRIYRGKDHQWELIHEDDLALGYNNMVWHNNQLWCTNDSGTWAFKDGKPVDVPSKARVCCGHLSARDGVLLSAGPGGAAFMDSAGQWHVLFLSVELESPQ